jgi:hypothetical protein
MQRSKRFLFSQLFFAASTLALLPFQSHAVEVPVETTGYVAVEGGSRIQSDLDLYVATFDQSAFDGSNNTDLVVIEELRSIGVEEREENTDNDDTVVYTGNYTGINLASGQEFDSGNIGIEVPVEASLALSANVVGFFRKSGPWIEQSGVEQGLISNMEGTLEYTTLETSRDINFNLQGVYQGSGFTITGGNELRVLDDDRVSIPQWQSDETSSFDISFAGTALEREGNVYEGLLSRNDSEEPESWISRNALIRITDTNDSDGDGVPDLSDLGSNVILGILQPSSIQSGSDSIWSPDLNATVFYDPETLWLYGSNIGWFYLPQQDNPDQIRIFIPDQRIGWIWTNKQLSPDYIRESDGSQLYFALVDGRIYFYDYATQTWSSLSY